MCLIAISSTGFKELDSDFWRHACAANPHGFGLMYHHKGSLVRRNELRYDAGMVQHELAEIPVGVQVAVHLREATHGCRGDQNVHPHVLRLQGVPRFALAIMHNGNIPSMRASSGAGPSDTSLFVQHWLRRKLVASPTAWASPAVLAEVRDLVGPRNRVVFLDNAGRWEIVGKAEGFEVGGCWLSNVRAKPWVSAPTANLNLF